MKKIIVSLAAVVLAIALVVVGCPASESTTTQAPETITLKFGSAGTPTHFLNALVYDPYVENLETLTEGRLQFEMYHGGVLASFPAEYDSVLEKVADLSSCVPSYTPGRFPVVELLEQPWGYKDGLVATEVLYDTITEFKPAEMADTHFVFGAASATPVILSNKPIHTMEDLQGMKIRATGNAVRMVEDLGGTPISMPIPDCYEALTKGTVDGVLTMINTMGAYKLAEAAKYMTEVPVIGYSTNCVIIMNNDTYNSLPEDIQELIDELSYEWSVHMGQTWYDADEENRQYCLDQNVEFYSLTPEEEARWSALMKPIRDEYIATLEAEGLPGEEISNFIVESINKYQ